MQHAATSSQAFDMVGISVSTSFEAGVPLRDVQIAAHADPRTTVGYDHRRTNFDKHAAYVVVAFVAGG